MQSKQAIVNAAWKSRAAACIPGVIAPEFEHHPECIDGAVVCDLDPVGIKLGHLADRKLRRLLLGHAACAGFSYAGG